MQSFYWKGKHVDYYPSMPKVKSKKETCSLCHMVVEETKYHYDICEPCHQNEDALSLWDDDDPPSRSDEQPMVDEEDSTEDYDDGSDEEQALADASNKELPSIKDHAGTNLVRSSAKQTDRSKLKL